MKYVVEAREWFCFFLLRKVDLWFLPGWLVQKLFDWAGFPPKDS